MEEGVDAILLSLSLSLYVCIIYGYGLRVVFFFFFFFLENPSYGGLSFLSFGESGYPRLFFPSLWSLEGVTMWCGCGPTTEREIECW